MQEMKDEKAVRPTEKNCNMAELSPSSSVITLNVNELNSPIKRQSLAEWGQNDPNVY